MENNVPAVREEAPPMTVDEMTAQVRLIQSVMKDVMHDKEHYGTIPGCGDKPTLLKPGAEKLMFTFRFAPRIEVTEKDMGRGHREYSIKVSIYSKSGDFLGDGVGSASTMESKWKYRTQNTGKEVPKEYWENRDSALLGGSQYSTRKINNKWMILEKIEHDNPADYYNTCLKMGKKRAMVDAVLTCTAASDIFTQDIEEMAPADTGTGTETKAPEKPKPVPTKKKDPPKAKTPPKQDKPVETPPAPPEEGKLSVQDELYQLVATKCGMQHELMKNMLDDVSGFDGKNGRVAMKPDMVGKAGAKWAGKALAKAKKIDAEAAPMPPACENPNTCNFSVWGENGAFCEAPCTDGFNLPCPIPADGVEPF